MNKILNLTSLLTNFKFTSLQKLKLFDNFINKTTLNKMIKRTCWLIKQIINREFIKKKKNDYKKKRLSARKIIKMNTPYENENNQLKSECYMKISHENNQLK